MELNRIIWKIFSLVICQPIPFPASRLRSRANCGVLVVLVGIAISINKQIVMLHDTLFLVCSFSIIIIIIAREVEFVRTKQNLLFGQAFSRHNTQANIDSSCTSLFLNYTFLHFNCIFALIEITWR